MDAIKWGLLSASHQLNAEDTFVGYGAAQPPAVMPPPTIQCRLRSEKAY